MANLAKICHAFGHRLSENLKKITTGTPFKVTKLIRVKNMTKVPRYVACMSRCSSMSPRMAESRIHASVYKGHFETTEFAVFAAYKVEKLLIVPTQFLAQLASDYGQDHVFITL